MATVGSCRDPHSGQGAVWGQQRHCWCLGLVTQSCALSLPTPRKVQGMGWGTESPEHGVATRRKWGLGSRQTQRAACSRLRAVRWRVPCHGSDACPHTWCPSRQARNVSGGTLAPAPSLSKAHPWLSGDGRYVLTDARPPYSALASPQLGGTFGQASPLGVLATQDRPCPVHQSSEASHPSPRHPAGTPSPTRPYMGTFGCWVAGGSPGGPNATVPPRLPGRGLAG